MAWKPGPLPANTWHWGGVVLKSEPSTGFYFADFCGDHVKIQDSTFRFDRRVEAHDVALYDNGLELPPSVKGRA